VPVRFLETVGIGLIGSRKVVGLQQWRFGGCVKRQLLVHALLPGATDWAEESMWSACFRPSQGGLEGRAALFRCVQRWRGREPAPLILGTARVMLALTCIKMPAWRPQLTRLVTRTKESDAYASGEGSNLNL
jgi:hypothetical protein